MRIVGILTRGRNNSFTIVPVNGIKFHERAALRTFVEERRRVDCDHINGELTRFDFLLNLSNRSARAFTKAVELEIIAKVVTLLERSGHALRGPIRKQRMNDCYRTFSFGQRCECRFCSIEMATGNGR